MPKAIHTLIACCGLCLLLFFIPARAHAQESTPPITKSALAVSPAIIEEVLEPGKAVPFTLQVNNTSSFPLPVKAMVRDFVVQSMELEKTERARLDASKWFTIQEPDFILQPHQTRMVKGLLKPPADAEPGGHYATIYFQPLLPQEALSPSTAYMNSQVGVLAFLIVKGDTTKSAEYATGLKAPSMAQSGPIDFTFSIKNSGGVHIMPTGTLRMYDWSGKEVGHQEIQPAAILPNATKEYTLIWDKVPFLGKYSAELEVYYGEEALQKTTVTFWVVPWGLLTISGILLASLLFFILKTRHRWSKAWRILRGKEMRLGS